MQRLLVKLLTAVYICTVTASVMAVIVIGYFLLLIYCNGYVYDKPKFRLVARSSVTWRWDSSALSGLYLRLESGPFRLDAVWRRPWVEEGRFWFLRNHDTRPVLNSEPMTLLPMLVLILLVLCAGLWSPRSHKTFYCRLQRQTDEAGRGYISLYLHKLLRTTGLICLSLQSTVKSFRHRVTSCRPGTRLRLRQMI